MHSIPVFAACDQVVNEFPQKNSFTFQRARITICSWDDDDGAQYVYSPFQNNINICVKTALKHDIMINKLTERNKSEQK